MSAKAAASVSPGRDPRLDGLKFAAALAVVIQHVAAAVMGASFSPLAIGINAACRWAVPMFLLTAGYLHGRKGATGHTLEWLLPRLRRLAIPYAFWSVFFVAYFSWLFGYPYVHTRTGLLDVVLFGGAGFWFLAFLLYASAIGAALSTVTGRRVGIALGLASYVGVVAFRVRPPWPGAVQFFLIAGLSLALYLIGMASAEKPLRLSPAFATLIGVLATVAGVLAALAIASSPWREPVVASLGALSAFLLFSAVRAGANPFGVSGLAWGGDLSLGIYVIQGVWLYGFMQLVPVVRLADSTWLALGALAVLPLTVVSTIALKRVRALRAVVL